jgi:NAD(P)-dependent dehydrogenase (short-subunit alcohol dehydrogenase family)
MTAESTVVVVGGAAGLGLEIVRHYAAQGRPVVLTSRDADRARKVAAQVGGRTEGLALDLAEPEGIADQLAAVTEVTHLVITAIERDENTVRDYDVARATYLTVLKLVGYTEVVHTLVPRMPADGAIVLFGGLAKSRPYPGSTTVSTVNGGITGMVHTMAVELAPLRVNALHPAIVGDSPYWQSKPDAVLDNFRSRTPGGRLITMADVVGATTFLLENRAINGLNLHVDGGWLLT